MLLLRHYKTQLLGRFNAFWSYCRGRGIVSRLLREILTIKTRDAGARMMCAAARVRVRACARVRVRACARIRMTPPLKKNDPPLKKEEVQVPSPKKII